MKEILTDELLDYLADEYIEVEKELNKVDGITITLEDYINMAMHLRSH